MSRCHGKLLERASVPTTHIRRGVMLELQSMLRGLASSGSIIRRWKWIVADIPAVSDDHDGSVFRNMTVVSLSYDSAWR